MPAISVVVPYYQREAGHLSRAIRSALRQQEVETPAIIVVDDSSPLPAAAVLAPYLRRQPTTIADMLRVLGEEGLRRALRACRIRRPDPAGAENGD